MQRRTLIQAAGAGLAAASLPTWAQSYPARPVRLVVPFPPGGPSDSFARLYAEALGKQLKQTVLVDNKSGASGAIGSLEIKGSTPDGMNLLFGTASTHALYNLIEPQPRYDAGVDFDYVAVLGGAPVAFAVSTAMRRHPSKRCCGMWLRCRATRLRPSGRLCRRPHKAP